MSATNDFISGLDISSLASVTQAQLSQMVNQATPNSNIGFVLCFDGIATGAAGVGFPDVTSNPRYVRYLWLDTNPNGDGTSISRVSPVFKRYVGAYTGGPSNPSALSNLYTDWTALGMASQAITTDMMRLVDASGGINLDLLKLNADNSATIGKAYYLITVDSAGVNFVASSLTDALANGGYVALASILTTGLVAGKYIGYSAGIAYRYLDPTVDFTALIGNRIPVSTAIAPGASRYILRTNAAGTAPEWAASGAVDLFQQDDIPIGALDGTTSTQYDVVYYTGDNWSHIPLSNLMDTVGSTYNPGTVLVLLGANITVAHGLATAPKLIRGVIQCIGLGALEIALGYAVGDEVEISAVFDGNNNQAMSVTANVTNIYMGCNATGAFWLPHRTGATAEGQITPGNWKMKLYYWK